MIASVSDSARVATPLEQKPMFDLKTLFPFEKFKTLSSALKKQVCVHYYLAVGGDVNKSNALKMLDKYVTLKDEKDPEYKLTPFAIAVMNNDEVMVKNLHARGCKIDSNDHCGWTPLHYAYLQGNQSMIDLLRTWGHDENIKSHSGATPKELVRRLVRKTPTAAEPVFFYLKSSNESIILGNSAKFHELTGAHYTNKMITTPKGLFHEWKMSIPTIDDDPRLLKLKPYMKSACQAFFQKKPKIYLGQSQIRSWGVFAGEPIKAGKIVEIYLGVRNGEIPSDTTYYTKEDRTDGKTFRNLGPMVNDGFPNTMIFSYPNIDGYKTLQFFVALDNIQFGDELYWDYTENHPCKQDHIETSMDKVVAWIGEQGIDLFQLPSKPKDSIKSIMRYFSFERKLYYLYNTPKTTFTLLLEGKLNSNIFFNLLNQFPPRKDSDFDEQGSKIIVFIKALEAITDDEFVNEIKAYFSKKLSTDSFTNIFTLINFFVNDYMKDKEIMTLHWVKLFDALLLMNKCVQEISNSTTNIEALLSRLQGCLTSIPETTKVKIIEETRDIIVKKHPDKVSVFDQLFRN